MSKEIKRQLLMSIILIVMISSTLFMWFDSFSFQTYTKIMDEQLCFEYNDDLLKIRGFELFYKNEVLQSGGSRIEGLNVKKNDVVTIKSIINQDVELTYKQTVKSNNQIIYLDYQTIKEKLNLKSISSIQMNINIQRNKKKVFNEEFELIPVELSTYTGGNKDFSISNAYLTDNWFKAGYFHSVDEEIYNKYPTMSIDYMYLQDSEVLNDYTRFIHIETDTQEFIDGLTDVYFYEGEDSLKDKTIAVVITLKGEQEFTFKIDLSATVNEGDKS